MAKLHRRFCCVLGWMFVVIGFAAMIANNHSDHRVVTGAPEWWAYMAALPVGALFLIAYGVAKPSVGSGQEE